MAQLRRPKPASSERVRVPPPVLRRRIPSGRGATEQPNATGDGRAALTPRFWLAIVLVGVAAGLFGAAMMAILFSVEALSFGSSSHGYLAAIEHTHGWARVMPLLLAGVVGGPAWYLLRRYTSNEHSELDDALWSGDATLSLRRCLGTSVISELVIGAGASIEREAAPKLLGGAAGTVVANRLGLTTDQRRLLVACGAGAGLAAVYNVPIGGAMLTAEVLLGDISLPTVMPALACSGIATLTGWVYLQHGAIYRSVPHYPFLPTMLVWALVAGPVIGVAASAWIRLVAWVSHHRVRGRAAAAAPLGAFAVLAATGLAYPQLFGNGKDMAHLTFLSQGTLALLLALSILKPLATALCLSSSASGGLFTPTVSTGAVLGGFLGLAWSHLWPGAASGAYGLVGGSAMLGAAMQAPLTGLVVMLELTHTGFQLAIPMIVATTLATIVARYLDGYSIYSARLGPHPTHLALAS